MSPHNQGQLWVGLQFGLLAALALLCALQDPVLAPGTVGYTLWTASLALGLWTLSANRLGNFNIRPEPKATGSLVQTGPYRWVRHPMYTSVLLLAAGAVTWLQTAAGAVLWLVLLGVLIAKASLEEHWLIQRYPAYAAYRQRTWRMVPRLY